MPIPYVVFSSDNPTNKIGKAKSLSRLSLALSIRHPTSGDVRAVALVDTGSEMNLVRRSLLPPSCFNPAVTKGNFRAANQTLVPGGEFESTFNLVMDGTEIDLGTKITLELPITCYDAEIGVDLIISYKWLAAVAADVIPRKHGIMVNRTNDTVWVPGIKETSTSHFPQPTLVWLNRWRE